MQRQARCRFPAVFGGTGGIEDRQQEGPADVPAAGFGNGVHRLQRGKIGIRRLEGADPQEPLGAAAGKDNGAVAPQVIGGLHMAACERGAGAYRGVMAHEQVGDRAIHRAKRLDPGSLQWVQGPRRSEAKFSA